MNVEREYRLCPFCLERNVYTAEDIFHFFMICPLYHDLRNIPFKPIWKMHIFEQRFYSIMKSTDVESIFSIAKLLVGAFELRKSIYGS